MKLTVAELRVESFPTAEVEADPRGTVEAHGGPTFPRLSCPPKLTCPECADPRLPPEPDRP